MGRGGRRATDLDDSQAVSTRPLVGRPLHGRCAARRRGGRVATTWRAHGRDLVAGAVRAPGRPATGCTSTTSATRSGTGTGWSCRAAWSTPTAGGSRSRPSCPRCGCETTTGGCSAPSSPAPWPTGARPITVTPMGDTGFHLGTGLYFGLDGHWHGEWRGTCTWTASTSPTALTSRPRTASTSSALRRASGRPGGWGVQLGQPAEPRGRCAPRDRADRGSVVHVTLAIERDLDDLRKGIERWLGRPVDRPRAAGARLVVRDGHRRRRGGDPAPAPWRGRLPHLRPRAAGRRAGGGGGRRGAVATGIRYEADPGYLGVPFMAMDFVPGAIPDQFTVADPWLAGSLPDDAARATVWASFLDAVTAVNAAGFDGLGLRTALTPSWPGGPSTSSGPPTGRRRPRCARRSRVRRPTARQPSRRARPLG